VARVSRFDRQLRYYSEALKLASVLSESWWAGFCGKSELQNLGPNAAESSKRRSKWSGISVLRGHWPPESFGRRLSAAPFAGYPAGLPFAGPLFGGGSCRGLLFLAYRFTAAGTSLAPF